MDVYQRTRHLHSGRLQLCNYCLNSKCMGESATERERPTYFINNSLRKMRSPHRTNHSTYILSICRYVPRYHGPHSTSPHIHSYCTDPGSNMPPNPGPFAWPFLWRPGPRISSLAALPPQSYYYRPPKHCPHSHGHASY